MEHLGKYLKEQREKSNLSYKDIWDQQKIAEEQVKLIENNDFFALGNYGFCKVLVFNYARFLNADIDMVMKELKVLMPENIKGRFKPAQMPKEKKIMLSTNFLWMVGITVFVIILGSILYIAYQNGYLRPPNFKDDAKAKASVQVSKPQVTETDTLRERMKMLTGNIPKQEEKPKETETLKKTKVKRLEGFKSDYVGELMGQSPINVELP